MLEDAIKKYYGAVLPSDKIHGELISRVKAQKKRRALILLTLQSTCSAAACLMLAVGINLANPSKTVSVTDENIGTVMAQPNGYILAGIVLAVLLTLFTGRYIAKQRKEVKTKRD